MSIEIRERVDWQSLSFPMETLPEDIMLSTALRGETAIHVVTPTRQEGTTFTSLSTRLTGRPEGNG